MFEPLDPDAAPELRAARYADVQRALESLLEGESDWTAAMATVASELHHAFDYFDWSGFYRAIGNDLLVIGPYQGGHGCLRIPIDRGICGAAARTRQTQLVADVHAVRDHIACASTTTSEIVVPIATASGRLLGVLDIDSDRPAAFSEIDRVGLERLRAWLGERFGG